MVRRAGRQTSREAARLKKNILSAAAAQIEKETRRALAKSIQEFAVNSMNNLAQAGPAWTGEFSQSWVFVAEGEPAQNLTAGATTGIGKYDKRDAPLQRIESYLKNGRERFQIVNTSAHALIAIDEESAQFRPPADQPYPIGDSVEYGTGRPRQEHLRWQIRSGGSDDEITSQITAEKDWLVTYKNGGQLQKDLSDGVRLGFSSKGL